MADGWRWSSAVKQKRAGGGAGSVIWEVMEVAVTGQKISASAIH